MKKFDKAVLRALDARRFNELKDLALGQLGKAGFEEFQRQVRARIAEDPAGARREFERHVATLRARAGATSSAPLLMPPAVPPEQVQ